MSRPGFVPWRVTALLAVAGGRTATGQTANQATRLSTVLAALRSVQVGR